MYFYEEKHGTTKANSISCSFLFFYESQIMRGKVSARRVLFPLGTPSQKDFHSVRTSTVRKLNSYALHRNLLRASDKKKRDFHWKIVLKKEMRLVFGERLPQGEPQTRREMRWGGLKQVCALLHCALVDLFRLGLSADLSLRTLTNPWDSQPSSLETAASVLAFPLLQKLLLTYFHLSVSQ